MFMVNVDKYSLHDLHGFLWGSYVMSKVQLNSDQSPGLFGHHVVLWKGMVTATSEIIKK